MATDKATIGVSDHAGFAVLVTATSDGTLLDRRRLDLVDAELPIYPHHHDGQGLPIDEAVALVERVRRSAERNAIEGLEALASVVPSRIVGVALRRCPELPPTIAERIRNYQASNVADWVMYRMAIADAARARGWSIHWYDAKRVRDLARAVLRGNDIEAHFRQVRRTVGPPWTADHKMAMAAAIVATAS